MVDRLMSDSVKPASIILEIFNLIKSRHILTNENHHLTQISLEKTLGSILLRLEPFLGIKMDAE